MGHVTETPEDPTIEYDVAGRKLNMTDPDMGKWYYAYDGDGQRVLVKQTGSRIDKTIYIGGHFEVFIKGSPTPPTLNCGAGRPCIYVPLANARINPSVTAGQVWKSYYSTGSVKW